MNTERNEQVRETLKSVAARYRAELECVHGGLLAYECATCGDKNDLLNSRTRNGTIRKVLVKFVLEKVFDRIEAFDPEKKKHTPISLKRLAKISGAVFVGGVIVYEMVKHRKGIKDGIVLHLIERIVKRPG